MTNLDKFGEVFAILSKSGALEAFRNALYIHADDLARQIASPEMTGLPQMEQVRGELRFCYLLADNADKALTASKAAASAEGEGGFQ